MLVLERLVVVARRVGTGYAGEAEGKIPEGNKPAEVVLFSLTETS